MLECPVKGCTKTFNRPAKLEDHINSHTGDRPFTCDECDQTYKKRTHLTSHKATKHSAKLPWTCQREDCSKAFATRQKLHRHEQSHAKQEQHRCRGFPPCNKHFRKSETLQRHIEQDHLADTVDKPPLSPEEDWEARVQTVKRTGRKVYACSESSCEATFTRKSDIREHLARVHDVGTLFVCGGTDLSSSKGLKKWDISQGCGASYTQKVSLENHVRSQHLHTEQKLQTVPLKTPDAMETRDNSDTQALLYTCPGCAETFSQDHDLAHHLRHAHGVDEADIAEILMEQAALHGGRFWVGSPDGRFDVDEAPRTNEDLLEGLLLNGENSSTAQNRYIDPSLLEQSTNKH